MNFDSKYFFAFSTLSVMILAIGTGCDTSNNPSISRSAMVQARQVNVGSECPAGGVAVNNGLDTNGNGILDQEEITHTQYVCNGTNGIDGRDGIDGTNGIDGINGTNGTNGTDGADGYSTLLSITPAATGTEDTLTFPNYAAPTSGVYPIATNLELLAVDNLGDTVSNGNAWTHYYYNINGYVNAYEWRPSENLENYYVLRTADQSSVGWKSIDLIDDGNWSTASITFYGYKSGVQIVSEVRSGDIPWSGSSGATTHTFVSAEFASVDTIVIAPRASNGTATPIGFTKVVLSTGCLNGGQEIKAGLDLDRDGILDPEEVQTTATICNG